ncbi:4-diphosphocytidyl-2-C-methyl-D-erythritol kinase [Aquimixticola soesokkakensis]|uniref:4-diphosphocytidyl-2-C-methyl-D-erythritol kinase n=1 Tax=Aquimixticola soesokkakensis TaxID=1519096 RepID=A0A1Y5SZ15_9RHOB|nr:4-(cytidine 5'-diphospho)-2-C-methyl-D-erythritol kinase [Aquimixticola soesokkakensis]SLN48397.1 4-diphosphocytidyl-2-C-methyl-D-erythritol kinase [Aquimixticola soesokkakensis]
MPDLDVARTADAVRVFAPAKINLSLHVTGQRADGYHLLDSLVVFVDVGDQISAARADMFSLALSGPMAAGLRDTADNLVLRAARLGGVPLALGLDKHLPVASGIGGGSTDAAAALKAAGRLGAPRPSAQEVLALGADVPVCLAGVSARMQGIGDVITAQPLPPLHMVLVNSGVPVATPDVFKGLTTKNNPPMEAGLSRWPDSLAFIDWLALQRNDLEKPACKVAPEIGATLVALSLSPDVLMVRMSGSGATCFGLYPSRLHAETAAYQIARMNPWWWVQAASTLPG